MESDKLYLVRITVDFISGAKVVAVDAFKAEDDAEARNMAHNLFIKERSGVVVYGGHVIFTDAVCSVVADNVGVLDATNPENASWVESAELFEKFIREDLKDLDLLNDERDKD
jgi:hypothetical protein